MHGRPHYSFSGIENFRDFGGFSGRHGPVREGLLFRSAHHANASDEDLDRLGRLGIATIVDLRRPDERSAQPSRRPPGFAGEVISDDSGDASEAPHVAFLKQGDLSDAAIERFLIEYYRNAPFEHAQLFGRAFAALENGSLLIHCTVGKDRTGLLAALIQLALGADDDTVMEEYLETNRAMLSEAKVARAAMGLKAMLGTEPSPVAIRALLGVEAHHLQAGLNAIADQAGSIDAYLDRLGVDRRRLLEAAVADRTSSDEA